MEKVEISEPQKKLPLGVSCIDSLLNGGLESGVMTEIYGEGGSGKTNLALLYTISCIRQGKRVIYIDTEGVSAERLTQISAGMEKLGDSLILYRVSSLEDQELAIMRCEKLMERYGNVGLITVDSFTEYFRLEKTSDAPARIAGFQKQLSYLSRVILKFNIPVLITNQVYQDLESGVLQPFGGYVINHAMKSILEVRKIDGGKRRLMVMKHRSIAEGQSIDFRIVSFGISCEA